MADDSTDFSPRAWLELTLVEAPRTAKFAWLQAFGSPGAVLRQNVSALRQVHETKRSLTDQLATADLDAVLDWLATSGGTCSFIGDDAYPDTMAAKFDVPPLTMFSHGNLGLLDSPIVALLGAAKPSEKGLERTRTFAYELAAEGIVVAAGISPGIAQAAHQGTQAASGKSVGVIGDVRAWEGVRLATDVANRGLLISELAPRINTAPTAYAQRHRLLAGLANLAVVVEAPAACDTLRLASLAGDLGCEVAAVPCDPGNTATRGGNLLLREGAALIENSMDIIGLISAAGYS